eukprot:m.164578 g.164578  ORF g.164578 m.164578 type:complete len:851 (-) comp15225_c0_seq3:104-2656(-)
MHSAFRVHQVIDWKPLPFQIESLDTCGTQLYVGTSKGQLLVYDITSPPDLPQCTIELRDTKKNFAKKPVVQLHAVKELNLLLSLSDNLVQIHDLGTLAPRGFLEKSRGCTAFAADLQVLGQPRADSHRLSEARKTTPWQQFTLRLAVVLKRKITTFTWNGSEFIEQKDLALPDVPRMVVWCGEGLLLGFKREYNIISEETMNVGRVFETGTRSEGIGVRLVGNELLLDRDNVSYFADLDGRPVREYGISWSEVPLAIEVCEPFALAIFTKMVEVRSLESGNLVQQIPFEGKPRTFAQDTMLLVASEVLCWVLKPVPLDQQLEELMSRQHYPEALALSARIPESEPSKPVRVMRIKKALALSEFDKKNYTLAFSHFAQLDIDPMEVISLLPFLVPDHRGAPARPAPDPTEQKTAAEALIEFLTQRRKDILRHSPDDARKQQYLETIDTTLLRCYLQFNQAMTAPFLRLAQNFCNVEESEKLLKAADKLPELVLLYRNRNMHRAALELLQRNAARAGPLSGPSHTVSYLQRLGPEYLDLILDFSKWVLSAHPADALAIFVHDQSPHAAQLPHDRVLAHLQACAPSLVIPYLECAINQWGSTSPDFHNMLAQAYLDRVVAAGIQEQGPERRQLLDFLTTSVFYRPEALLTLFASIDGLFEERAILLGRTGKHAKALELYALRLRSPEKAEQYCARVFAKDPSIYLALLKIYLPDNGPINVAEALTVLRVHHDRIDTTEALKLLPASTKLREVREFLVAVLQDRAVMRRDAQLLRSLAKVENLQVRTDLLQVHAVRVEITDEQLCLVCRKAIKTSAFAYYPSGVMVHLFCSKDPAVCPCSNPKCTLTHETKRAS